MARDVASEAQLQDPRNLAKVEQAIDLIQRGKTAAAIGDPRLSPFVNALLEKGVVSAEQIRTRLVLRRQEEAKVAAAERVAALPTITRAVTRAPIIERIIRPARAVIPTTREQELLSFQSRGEIVFKAPRSFAVEVNQRTGATSFTSAIPLERRNGKIFVQDFNFRFDKEGNFISAKKTGSALLNESLFLQRDKSRSEGLLREAAKLKAKLPKVDALSIFLKNLIVPKGSGTITRAIDVGGKKMQDFILRFLNGKVISATPLGKPIPQTKKFKEKVDRIKLPESLIQQLKVEEVVAGIPLRETIRVRTPAEERRFFQQQFERPPTLLEGLEKVEVALFPALIGKKFLDSQLGARLTSGKIQEEDRATADKVRELLPRTAGVGLTAARASLELLQLIRQTDANIQRDLRKAEGVGKTFERLGARFDKINSDLEAGDISNDIAITRQNELLNKFNAQGFILDEKNGKVDISHPVYDRLSGFTGSAWTNILKQARKGDSPVKDQALIGTLDFLNSAYEVEKIVLAFNLAGAAGLKFPAVTGTKKAVRTFNTIAKLSGGALISSFGALSGARRFEVTGEPLLGITSAAGTIAGFLAPGALIRANNLLKKIDQRIKTTKPITETKAAKKARTKQVQVQKKAVEKRKKVRLQITTEQAQKGFAKAPRSKQIEIIERVFRGKEVTQSDLALARNFMKKSGLVDFQIQDRLAEALRRIQLGYVRDSVKIGIITQQQAKIQIKVLRDGKSRLLKLLKEKTIAAQTIKLTPFQVTQQKNLVLKIGSIQAQLDRGFLTPFQENILRNELSGLKTSLGLLTKKKVITIPSPFGIRVDLIQKQIQDIKVEQIQTKKQIQQATTSGRKDFLQGQLQQQKQKQVQLQDLAKQQVVIQRQRQTQQVAQQTQQQLRLLLNQQQRQRQLQNSLTRQLQMSTSATRQAQLQKQLTLQKQLQKQTAKQITKLKLRQRILPKPLLPPPFFGIDRKKQLIRKRIIIDKFGYNAFAKQRGLFRKLNKRPISKAKAKDLAAWVVDNSTSARGKIVRVIGKKAQKPLKRIPQNYFTKTSKKYRTFKIVQGKKIPLKNEFIEKKRHRIDTIGEKRGLGIARTIAKLKAKKPIKAFKNKSNFKSTRLIKFRNKKK